MNPYVFFVGCPRSGTTLLRRIGDAHPQLAVVHESRWIARTFKHRRGLTPEGLVTSRLLERLRQPKRLKALQMREEDLTRALRDADGDEFSAFVTALFDRYGERQGKALVGDKSPSYVRYVPTLHELWPQAKFVHIVRDGRDVCLSVLDWHKGAAGFSPFRDDPVTTTAVWWEWNVQLGMEGGSRVGPKLYHELRYESLVAAPERESARVCHFLGIAYDEAMLRFHEGRTRDDPALDAKKAWKPVTPGLRSWRTEMPAEDVIRFEAAAGHLLERFGYERAVASVPRADVKRAASIRKQFADQVRASQGPLPYAWLREAGSSRQCDAC